MRINQVMVAAALLTGPIVLGGCESTQSKNARAEKNAVALRPAQTSPFAAMKGAGSSDIQAGEVTVLTDEVGTAVVVQLRNAGKEAYEVPVQLEVLGADGGKLYTNAVPGIQRSLTHSAVVPAGEEGFWVNDQVPVTTGADKAQVTVGAPEGRAPAPPVNFTVSDPTVEKDPASGFVAKGFVETDAPQELRRVLVTVIARKGKTVVAAGRGVVARIKPGKRARFSAFFIGAPQGAELTAFAQPNIDAE